MRVVAALLVLLLLAPLAAAQQASSQHAPSGDAALAAIDACVARLDPEIDVGYERIAVRCPDLLAQLEGSGWSAWLPATWKDPRNDLSAGGLQELRVVVSRELAARVAARTPKVEVLQEILAGLGETARERTGFWVRFKTWVRSLFERRDEGEDVSWLGRIIDRIGLSQAVMEIITYVLLGIVVALAVMIVFNELRAAGLIGARRVRKAADGMVGTAVRARLSWRDVETADLVEKPRVLLELIAMKLTDLKRLPPSAALTARELARAAELPDTVDRARLVELATTAERVRYSDAVVAPASVEVAVERGRELLTRIEGRA